MFFLLLNRRWRWWSLLVNEITLIGSSAQRTRREMEVGKVNKGIKSRAYAIETNLLYKVSWTLKQKRYWYYVLIFTGAQ